MPRLYTTPIERAPALLAPDTFRFLNIERLCSTAADWRRADVDRLWIFNLHYFDDLNARGSATRFLWHENLLERWVVESPPGEGDAWEPYPVSRRIVNWVKWALRGNELSPRCRASLAVQARWLDGRLEYRLLGNHLLANAKALIHAGLYFDGVQAEHWYARGVRIIERELPEQVLADGGHFELSTLYHATVLEDLLDLVNLLQAYGRQPPDAWLNAVTRMRRWLQVMSHPDGEISFFNDAAFGVAPTGGELAEYAKRLHLPLASSGVELPLAVLAASGYVRARIGRAWLICDCAAVGPDHQPGHAHADTLSFEMSLDDRRVFVNSGTSQYGTGAERQRQRATAAHNTVVLDEHDSTEVWAGFRVARRARARLHAASSTATSITIEASHDGYRRLPGSNEHLRRWTLDEQSLCIVDTIRGTFRTARACFHLHPQVTARLLGSSQAELMLQGGTMARMVFDGADAVEVQASLWHPQFGVAVANNRVTARFSGASLTTRVQWLQR